MAELRTLADDRGLLLLEDAAQAAGARLDGRRVGALGDAATFSFFPSKNLFCLGDGGAVATSDPGVAERARLLRLHGSRDKTRYEQVGYNSRLDALQAAALRVALPRLEGWTAGRRALWEAYLEQGLGELVTLPSAPSGAEPAPHMNVVRSERRDELVAALQAAGVESRVQYAEPLHRQPAMRRLRRRGEPARHRPCGRDQLRPAERPDARRPDRSHRDRCAAPSPKLLLMLKRLPSPKDPAFRHRMLQVLVDAGLVALAFFLAFLLRFDSGIPPRYQRSAGADDRRRRGREGGDLRRLRPLPEVVALRRPARLRDDPQGGRRRQPRAGRRPLHLVADRERPAALGGGDGPVADRGPGRRRAARDAQRDRAATARRRAAQGPGGPDRRRRRGRAAGGARDAAQPGAAPDPDRLHRRRPAQARHAHTRAEGARHDAPA